MKHKYLMIKKKHKVSHFVIQTEGDERLILSTTSLTWPNISAWFLPFVFQIPFFFPLFFLKKKQEIKHKKYKLNRIGYKREYKREYKRGYKREYNSYLKAT